jgi:hypothetical protein
MDNKKLLYVVGGIALIGVGYYLINKNKKKGVEVSVTLPTDNEGDVKPIPKPAPPVEKLPVEKPPVEKIMVKKLTAQELEMQLQSACGKKPLRKKNVALYNQCREKQTAKLRTQGMISFEGTYSYEDVVGDNFYSSFNSNFDLNL